MTSHTNVGYAKRVGGITEMLAFNETLYASHESLLYETNRCPEVSEVFPSVDFRPATPLWGGET